MQVLSKGKHSNEIYQIKETFNCNSKMVIYLTECWVCSKQYNSIAVKLTTIKAHITIFKKSKNYQTKHNQKLFHNHYLMNVHSGICDWQIIIDHAETILMPKELYWYHKSEK